MFYPVIIGAFLANATPEGQFMNSTNTIASPNHT